METATTGPAARPRPGRPRQGRPELVRVRADDLRADELQAAASSVLVPLRVTGRGTGELRASMRSAAVGPMTVTRIRSGPHLVAREPRLITSSDHDLLKVTLHRRGTAVAAQDGRAHPVRPGDMVVFDTRRPYRLSLDAACEVVVVGLPRDMVGPGADAVGRRSATPLRCDAGTGALVGAFLSGLGEHLEDLDDVPGIHLADALAALITAAFAGAAPERAGNGTELTDRIIAYTLANLGDPALSVASVARRHGISPRRLHQLFRERGHTFAAWVRWQRLHRIRRDLLDPALAHRTTAAIAARWGIHDAGHLGRAFRKEFGRTTAEIRGMAR